MRTPPIHVAPGQVFEFPHGRRRVARVNSDGTVVLACPLSGEETTIALTKLVELHLAGVARDRESNRVQAADVDRFVRRSTVSKTPAEREDHARRHQSVARRITYVNALVAEGRIGPLQPAFETCIRTIAERIDDRAPPSAWTAYRWLCRYRRSGFNPDVLARRELFIRKRQPRIAPEVKAAIAKHALDLLAQNRGATLHSVTDMALALTARDLGHVQFRDQHGRTQVALTFIGEKEQNARNGTAPARNHARDEEDAA